LDTITTTVTGATQFNVTLDLEAVASGDLPAGMDETFIIYNIAYSQDGVAHDFHCWLQLPGGAATQRIDIIDVTAETGFSKAGCRIPVPRTAVAPWQVRFTTVGKAADGSFIVSAQKASVETPT
jgi:hypothetical protein